MAKFAVETKLAKLAVDTKLPKLAVETKFARLAVLTIEPNTTVERYPKVPSPIIVLVTLDCLIFAGEFCIS